MPNFKSIAATLWMLEHFPRLVRIEKALFPATPSSAMSVVVIGSSKLSPLRVGGINSYKMRGQTWKSLENWVFFVHTVWSHVGLFTWEIWSRSLGKRAYIKNSVWFGLIKMTDSHSRIIKLHIKLSFICVPVRAIEIFQIKHHCLCRIQKHILRL